MPLDSTTSPAAARLIAARGYIEEHGWSPLRGRDGNRVCPVIAIAECGGRTSTPEDAPVIEAANAAFRLAIGRTSIPGWSDALGRTEAEVLAAFDYAIELALVCA